MKIHTDIFVGGIGSNGTSANHLTYIEATGHPDEYQDRSIPIL